MRQNSSVDLDAKYIISTLNLLSSFGAGSKNENIFVLEKQSQVCKDKIICYTNTGPISMRNGIYNLNVELQSTTQENSNKNIAQILHSSERTNVDMFATTFLIISKRTESLCQSKIFEK